MSVNNTAKVINVKESKGPLNELVLLKTQSVTNILGAWTRRHGFELRSFTLNDDTKSNTVASFVADEVIKGETKRRRFSISFVDVVDLTM